jgi:ubiquinone/menaquinone biosynthesis C-methylase UbiE
MKFSKALLFVLPFVQCVNEHEQHKLGLAFNTPEELAQQLDLVMFHDYQVEVQRLMEIKPDSLILDVGAGKGHSDIAMVENTPGFEGKIHLVEGDRYCHFYSIDTAESKGIKDKFEFIE